MNALEQFYFKLDESGWDVKDEGIINTTLQKVNEKLIEDGLNDIQHLAEIDRQSFHFNKSPEKRLSFKTAGTRKMEDGKEIPFEWPDIREFSQQDFDYLFKRFSNCKNLFAKTEYGLVLYYSKHKQDNIFLHDLLKSLFELLKAYIENAKEIDDKNHYIIYARIVLANALHIAHNRRKYPEVESIFKNLIEYTFLVHQEWDISNKSTLRTIIDFTDFFIEYFKEFIQYIDLHKALEKNWEAADYLSKTYIWGSIYIAEVSVKLCKKLEKETKAWHLFSAKQYEKLFIESKDTKKLASISYVEKAMLIYKSLKDTENLSRLEKEYQVLRSDFKLGEIKKEIPLNETQRLMELIRKDITEKSEEEIIKTLLFTPMIRPLYEIKKWTEDTLKQPLLLDMLPVSIQDKFGNTVAKYHTEDERKRFALLRTYEFHFQIAIQTIQHYFIEAFKSDKISKGGIISLLNQTWMGQNAHRRINGSDVDFSYIKIIESGISTLFMELDKWKNDSAYIPNFVCAIDSLVLKAEYFLREFCYFLNIPTFKSKDENIIMERTLDDIINDIRIKEALTEDDHFFIKFILIDKAGYNLRNRIAHGLLDSIEYGLEYAILSILIILKLSNYKLNQPTDE
jgi:hypothetical protein